MVKGISRQVIVVHSPDPRLFDQAIFILRDEAVKNGITDELLMKEAKQLINAGMYEKKGNKRQSAMWASLGAAITCVVWLITAFF